MKAIVLSLAFLLGLLQLQAQTATELAAQLTADYENKYGISLTDYQRQSINSNYFSAIKKLEGVQHLQATNPMLYEQQRQKIVADAELRNSRLLTGSQMRQINAGTSTSVTWPGKESAPEEVVEEEAVEEVVEEESWEEESTESTEDEDWGEDESWEEESTETTEEESGDILDKAVNRILTTNDSTRVDSSKSKKVLKKGLKFLYDELLRPALDKSLDDKGKKEKDQN